MTILIKNARIIDPANKRDEICDIFIQNGIIKSVEKNLSIDADREINAEGYFAVPGLVDMHVHLRDPGQTHKEDIISGCTAAASGGITALAAMPNTTPPIDSPDIVKYVLNKAKSAPVRVLPVGSISKGMDGKELSGFDTLKSAGAIAFSDDGRPVVSSSLLLEAMKKAESIGLPVLSHCEELSLAGGIINEGEVSEKLGVKGIPASTEDVDTARVAALAESSGLPVHICHVSTKTSLRIIKHAKNAGVRLTCETAPHYFTFTDSSLITKDADYRMNPPLRGEEHRLAVIDAIKDGTIDAIATDHAPHTGSEKADFESAPNGVIGLQTSFSASYTALVKTDIISINRLVELMSVNPANILKTPYGTLSEGCDADIVLFDPNAYWTVAPNELSGKSHNTPFKGMKLFGQVKMTICRGEIAHNIINN